MSNLARAAHHHHHHGLKMPSLKHLEAKVSSLVAVAQGQQGTTARDALFAGLAIAAVLIVLAVRKVRA